MKTIASDACTAAGRAAPAYSIKACPEHLLLLADVLKPLISGHASPLIILCIGSMLVPGDSLGPRVGTLLEQRIHPGLCIFGTEAAPVHALNLEQTLAAIRREYPSSPVLAVDAALAPLKYLGHIIVGSGSLSPGKGLAKSLAPAGDFYIAAVTGLSGPLGYPMLRRCAGSHIQSIAHIIAGGICLALTETAGQAAAFQI